MTFIGNVLGLPLTGCFKCELACFSVFRDVIGKELELNHTKRVLLTVYFWDKQKISWYKELLFNILLGSNHLFGHPNSLDNIAHTWLTEKRHLLDYLLCSHTKTKTSFPLYQQEELTIHRVQLECSGHETNFSSLYFQQSGVLCMSKILWEEVSHLWKIH